MSLYIGNLSARTRRDELELVFRRFGRCNVQIKKDGYGFVVFEFPPNAEKALRALQGRNICGEPLTLTWSNKQPQAFQNVARGVRSYESQRGRNSLRVGDFANRKMHSNGQRHYKIGIKQPDNDGVRLNSSDMLDDETGYHQHKVKDHIKEERQSLHDEGGSVVANLVDNDRWGWQAFDPSNDNEAEDGVRFDRYEPHQGNDGIGESENQRMGYTGGSPAPRSSQENLGKEKIGAAALQYPNYSKARQTCYSCGASGHKVRNCPKEQASRRKSTQFDLRQSDEINRSGRGKGKLDRFGSKSWGRLRSRRDATPERRKRDNRRASGSRNHQRLIKSGRSPVTNEADKEGIKDYGGKKRRRDIGHPTQSTVKKVRRSISSSDHSYYTASRSRSTSKSSKSARKSSISRSISCRKNSPYSNSRSSLKSDYSGYRSSKSRSRSRGPTSLSRSSSGRSLPSSQNKVQLNPKGSLYKATTPESKDILVHQGMPVDGSTSLENAKLEKARMEENDENIPSSSKVGDDLEKDHHMEMDGNGNHITSGSLYEVTNPSSPLSERGAFTAGSSFPGILGNMTEFENPAALEMEHVLAPINKPDSEICANSQTGRSASISSDEMYMALKHYGLEVPRENERHLSIEAYFGSARLWPWEIIYYRRLKRGPISIENHARRVAQNEEFGIVDKYIRSSSGWGEMDQDDS